MSSRRGAATVWACAAAAMGRRLVTDRLFANHRTLLYDANRTITTAANEEDPVTRTERSTLLITGAAFFMVVLDNLSAAATLPSIQKALGGSLATLEWVLNAYILGFAVLMLTAAALG